YHKALALKEVGGLLDGFVGMDERVTAYLARRYPGTPCTCIPLAFAPEAVTDPLPEQERSTDVLWLARLERSARRQAIHDWLRRVRFPMRHISAGLYGAERDRVVAGARLSL